MSILDNLSGKIPFLKKEENKEYFFALNIGAQKVKACLWVLEGNHLKVLNPVVSEYSSSSQLLEVADQLLDQTLGDLPYEPEKILFGVPDSWLQDDDIKEEYLKILRGLVKALEIKPLAYVATSHALAHFLEKEEGAPVTGIFVGTDEDIVAITVSRAGKVDGTKIIKRGDNLGQDVEKALLSFSEVEVLPSRILIYGKVDSLTKQKQELASFPWMSKLSFLHLPKLETLEDNIDIKAVSFAGAIELNPDVKFLPEKQASVQPLSPVHPVTEEAAPSMETLAKEPEERKEIEGGENLEEVDDATAQELGFVSGDVTQKTEESKRVSPTPSEQRVKESKLDIDQDLPEDLAEEETAVAGGGAGVMMQPQKSLPIDEYESETALSKPSGKFPGFPKIGFSGIPKIRLLIPLIIIILLILAYLFVPRATVTIFVEPKILENDTQVQADPNINKVDEVAKKIPGSFVETQVSGSDKASATGEKEIGDSAKGTVIIYNKTNSSKTLSKGAVLNANGLKFALENDVKIASQSASEEGINFGKANGAITANQIGADSNLPSGTTFTINGVSSSEVSAKAEGNFSGGTSKKVTVVTDADQKKLLATLASNLRKQATEQLQAKLQEGGNDSRKILEEALSEEIAKKTYNKNVGDQANEFSLNLTINYKGLAYAENDLKLIVSKLVETNVPEGFELDLAQTETSADVSKVEKDKLTFLARFKAKLIPKIDKNKVKKQIVGKSPQQVADILKSYENVLGSEIKIVPPLPGPVARIPFLEQNIKIEVSLK